MRVRTMESVAVCLVLIFAGARLVAAELPDVQPPRQPLMSKDPGESAPQLKQPPVLEAELMALTEGSMEERVAKLKRKVLKDLVWVESGSFMMGDFGPWWSREKMYYTTGLDNKPPHKVTLTGYNMARYKTTYAEFDVFADATGQERAGMELRPGSELPRGFYRHPLIPVGVYWHRARDYCLWLGKQTGVPFSLPTEAQWEYAARSRGQNFIWATDNGHMDKGRNMASDEQKERLRPVVSTDPEEPASVTRAMLFPVGIFPPNPLGLYDMNANGWEWMQDWYDAKWYRVSPERDPLGPPTGTLRSLRGYAGGDYVSGLNVIRYARDPMIIGRDILTEVIGPKRNTTHSVRCVANQDHPVEVER
ncbi:formylglycine-generating enzyme family protein [Cupriavidus basilensis]|uniref:formylglycine-generating enzyme family protein n=1 Tax=Cupriavidus basilensis TaxID=68895 RepID=UPI00283BF7B4|nr:SUMF1/EgtB/PvdO family nonheme iron enzyme [Cupriavidus basilensis]MDR3380596.1 SUMF1/EgtB/PvdO family nonheme iron enzyme [Cupriavidus basilensis]